MISHCGCEKASFASPSLSLYRRIGPVSEQTASNRERFAPLDLLPTHTISTLYIFKLVCSASHRLEHTLYNEQLVKHSRSVSETHSNIWYSTGIIWPFRMRHIEGNFWNNKWSENLIVSSQIINLKSECKASMREYL